MVVFGPVPRGAAADVAALLAQVPRPRRVVVLHPPDVGSPSTSPADRHAQVWRDEAVQSEAPDAEFVPCPQLTPAALAAVLRAVREDVRIEDPATRWAATVSGPGAAPEYQGRVPVAADGTLAGPPPHLCALTIDDARGVVDRADPVTGHVYRGREVALCAEGGLPDRLAACLLGEAAELLADHPPTETTRRWRVGSIEAARVAVALDDLATALFWLDARRMIGPARAAAAAVRAALLCGDHGVLCAAAQNGEHILYDVLAGSLSSAFVARRACGLAPLDASAATSGGLTGANARASGVPFDARTADDAMRATWAGLGWEPTVCAPDRAAGDVLARLRQRAAEGLVAARVVQTWSADPGTDTSPASRALADSGAAQAGMVDVWTEAPRGLLGCTVVATGDPAAPWWRVRWSDPSARARGLVVSALDGLPVEDVPLVVASFGLSPVEADR